jgi:spore coat polysaccharide biosynthesis protein SpsF (cytidylyltransferase family)/aryl-alcohol dehydrogenase-like predicted oxidoreductase
MKPVVILQARTTSSRLPGKALLPIAGYPCAVLGALRAANRGHRVIVATSTDPSDDSLADALNSAGVEVFRGQLDDVLARYNLAAADLPTGTVIVRLTGDNVLPDGAFVEELSCALIESNSDYLCTSSPQSRLPYGLGGEAFTVDMLRSAHANATSAYDREHVGTWITRNCHATIYSPRHLEDRNYGHLRCTIDDEEDYQRIQHLFDGVSDPLRASWFELTQKLNALPGEPQFRVPYSIVDNRVCSTMTLGTAQLGMDYGAVNRTGKPHRSLAIEIVRKAIAHGITTLDTARAYGDSEQVLKEALSGAWRSRAETITKLDPLAKLSPHESENRVTRAVEASVSDSCHALGTNRLSVLLLHRWNHHDAWHGAAWRTLVRLRDSGKVARLGASVYRPDEALAALEDPTVQHLQLPMNLLDSRWRKCGIEGALSYRRDVIVHARSVFLQGILLHPASAWPDVRNYDARQCVARIQDLVRRFNREGVSDLCVAYVRSQNWINSLVLGCETMAQLEENLKLFRLPILTCDQCEEINQSFTNVPEEMINPSNWTPAHA